MVKKCHTWWPIITGETEDPEEDKIVGLSIVKEGQVGITLEQAYELPTREVLKITGGAYSLKKVTEEGKE